MRLGFTKKFLDFFPKKFPTKPFDLCVSSMYRGLVTSTHYELFSKLRKSIVDIGVRKNITKYTIVFFIFQQYLIFFKERFVIDTPKNKDWKTQPSTSTGLHPFPPPPLPQMAPMSSSIIKTKA